MSGAADLVLEPRGGAIRYSARLSYAPKEPPREPRDSGLFLVRTVTRGEADEEDVTFATRSVDRILSGDLVSVTLHLIVPQAHEHVLVDDALPAGLQVVNRALATEAGKGRGDPPSAEDPHGEPRPVRVFSHQELREERVILYARKLEPGIYRHTYLARAMTPGRFHAPVGRTEAMYRPERWGRTAASVLTVVENRTGEVLAYVGLREWRGSPGGRNDGVRALRQPGSTLKPFAYALAFERGLTPATILADLPAQFTGSAISPAVP